MATAALVLAAGRGVRLGADVPKAFVELAGATLLERSLRALAASEAVDAVLPVLPPGDGARWTALRAALADLSGLLDPVSGGEERQDSVRAGLAALGPEVTWVAVHDAARALVRTEDVTRVVRAAQRGGAALLAVPVRDTIKRVRGGRVVETPPRAECWAAQTPQVFRCELLREALEKAAAEGFLATDDAQLVERLGVAVEIVEGSADNVKVTGPEDLPVAERLLAARGAR
jgi:2-C-methyl-D-erythritol 4-phosphate cytidylyltransferase